MSGTGGAGGTSSSSTSSGMGGMGMGGTGQGGAGGSGPMLLNGCDAATAVDHTADAAVTITFSGFTYDPACIKVKAGTDVTFEGSFAAHPLRGGVVVGPTATEDPNSPIKATSNGMMATFTMTDPGDYGYYCSIHYTGGMMGAVYVVP